MRQRYLRLLYSSRSAGPADLGCEGVLALRSFSSQPELVFRRTRLRIVAQPSSSSCTRYEIASDGSALKSGSISLLFGECNLEADRPLNLMQLTSLRSWLPHTGLVLRWNSQRTDFRVGFVGSRAVRRNLGQHYWSQGSGRAVNVLQWSHFVSVLQTPSVFKMQDFPPEV